MFSLKNISKILFLVKKCQKTLEGHKKITELPNKKGNYFLSVFLPGESIKKKKTKKSKLLQFCSAGTLHKSFKKR
jgi:hypothetical protein